MKISLTSFVDFVLKSGSPKITCAEQIKARLDEGYGVMTDYYKRFREGVIELHSSGRDKKDLGKIIGPLPEGKEDNYAAMIAGHKKFLGSRTRTWFAPKKALWKHGSLEVAINPEIGLEWEGNRYLIKLYLKAEKPSKDRITCVLALMQQALKAPECKIGLLDVRNSKLYEFAPTMAGLVRLAESEALSLDHLLS